MTLRMAVPDRPDLAVDVLSPGRPDLAHRMAVRVAGDPDERLYLACDCGWETALLGPDLYAWTTIHQGLDERMYLDDLALISQEHYRTADQPGLVPAQTTT